MAHERAKKTLLRAATILERDNAIRKAIASGMPLADIEEYLDYVDATAKPGEAPTSFLLRVAPSRIPARATFGPRGEKRFSGTLLSWVCTAIVAGLLFAVTLNTIQLYRPNVPGASQPIYVAELGDHVDAKWSEDGMPEANGRLRAGRRLVLNTGIAEIAFTGGARVILEGPAEFEPLSPTSGLLSQGLLSAHVPPVARGFVIRAPDATVVDWGTEFGVAVEHGGLSDVEVFTGRVEVELAGGGKPTGTKRVLAAGEAIHVWSPTENGPPVMETAAAGLMHFVRSLPSVAKPADKVAKADASANAAQQLDIPAAAEELAGLLHDPKGRLVYLDLVPYTNEALSEPKGTVAGNDLLELGAGEQNLAGVGFRIGDSTIQLGSQRLPEKPSRVEDIPVARRVATLYFLHATQWGAVRFGIADGTDIGHYQVHYVDGSRETIPIICGEDVRDWWSHDHKTPATRGQVVWVGRNAATKQATIYLRMYLSVWENPHPEKTIASLDYVSAMTVAAPFCAAITAEMPLPIQARPPSLSAPEPDSEF